MVFLKVGWIVYKKVFEYRTRVHRIRPSLLTTSPETTTLDNRVNVVAQMGARIKLLKRNMYYD